MSRWVVDTSPLVFLAKLDRLDLLRRSADLGKTGDNKLISKSSL